MSRPRVLVTRPLAQTLAWTQALQERGVAAEVFALIDIAPLPDVSGLQTVWRSLHHYAALMFVSANAVRHFMAVRPGHERVHVQAWGTGVGTAAALREAAWPEGLIRCPGQDAPTQDSEALWALVSSERMDWSGQRVLIVRGADAQGQLAGRDWLMRQLAQAGAQVTQCVAYQRRPPALDAAMLARAREALQDGSWWLFSSSEAAQHLAQCVPGAIGAASQALATHPRIAARLRAQGWGRVVEVPPTLEGQIASIECLA